MKMFKSFAEAVAKRHKKGKRRRSERKEAKAAGYPEWIMKMPDGSEKDRAKAVHRATMKRKMRK